MKLVVFHTINGKRALLISVYISPNTSFEEIRQFFILNLFAYSPQLKGMFTVIDEQQYSEIPIVLSGDLNLDLRGSNGAKFLDFVRDRLGLELNNDLAVSTTRNSTCIDVVLSRHIEKLETKAYISYFSTHRPLLTTTLPFNESLM